MCRDEKIRRKPSYMLAYAHDKEEENTDIHQNILTDAGKYSQKIEIIFFMCILC
jgi:hypothetical protein